MENNDEMSFIDTNENTPNLVDLKIFKERVNLFKMKNPLINSFTLKKQFYEKESLIICENPNSPNSSNFNSNQINSSQNYDYKIKVLSNLLNPMISPSLVPGAKYSKGYKLKRQDKISDRRLISEECIYKILSGKDNRTTLMIKNIPNKYTPKMLLYDLNLEFKGKFDLLYLVLDFKKNCNMGYAFVNFTDPLYIVKFYEKFNGKCWSRFNSLKVFHIFNKICCLAYAKYQGKEELINHYKRGEVEKYKDDQKPIIFDSLNIKQPLDIPLVLF